MVGLWFSILLVGPRVWGCCFSVGEFASGCHRGPQLAFYPKCDPVTTCHAKCHTQVIISIVVLCCVLRCVVCCGCGQK